MKTIIDNYSFTASTKQIDFTSYTPGFDIRHLYMIINLKRNTPIYQCGVAGYSYTSVVGDVVTLQFDTTGQTNSDPLLVLYDTVDNPVYVDNFPASYPVTGTFWQATQPVSGTVGISGTVPVSGTFWQSTQPVSAASLPLPTGSATESTLSAINTKIPSQYNDGIPITNLIDQTTPIYSATLDFTIASSATDIFTITGSATKKIIIRHISVSGTQSTSDNELVSLIKRSTADSGGTSTLITPVPIDSTYPAATATVNAYTANPATLGTTVGTLQIDWIFIPDSGTNKGSESWGFRSFENFPIAILRGVNEQLCINLNSRTLLGNSMCCHVIWSEWP